MAIKIHAAALLSLGFVLLLAYGVLLFAALYARYGQLLAIWYINIMSGSE
jgi:hypothetical protein